MTQLHFACESFVALLVNAYNHVVIFCHMLECKLSCPRPHVCGVFVIHKMDFETFFFQENLHYLVRLLPTSSARLN